MTVPDILSENRRRNAVIHAPYDPLAGGDSPDRIHDDFPYWCAKYAFVKKKGGGGDVPFILNRPQRRLVALLESMRRADKPIRLILLKARQWGGSTCLQLYMAWLQLVHAEGLNSLIVAHQRVATDEIKDMFDRLLEHYKGPDNNLNLKAKKVGGSDATYRVEERNCKVKLATAERPHACRGGDYNLIHCSEVALWPDTKKNNPKKLITSATSGVLYAPLTMIVLESTANGTHNYFHNEYEAASQEVSQFKAMFVPWYEIDDYTLPFPSGKEEEFARRLLAEKDVATSVIPRRPPGAYLWNLWENGATLEALHWYVIERSKYDTHEDMASEYPSDDIEAFVHSGAKVFDPYKVKALKRYCCDPLLRGELDGDARFGPKALDKLRFNACETGLLQIWRKPHKDHEYRITDRYVVVVDIGGRSSAADWSVITVFDRAPMRDGRGPEVVAQWRGHTDFDLLTWNAARIAKWYEEALLVIESNTLETHDAMRDVEGDQSDYILSRLHDAYPRLYERRRSEAEIVQGTPAKYGFHTNRATKPMIITSLVQIVREGMYIERDKECLDELLTYEKRPNGSYGALPGYHDDLLMTRAIGLHICYNELPAPRAIHGGLQESRHQSYF